MSDNNIQTNQPSSVKGFMALPTTKKRVEELLGERSSNFMTSVSTMIGSDDKLAQCEPVSLFMACLTAAALDLPINKNLGFAHIIPYGKEAQFQMGWRGYVQLAQRTGKYKTIAATAVYEGQLAQEDPLEGNTYDWDARTGDDVIGYVAKFTTINGFQKEVYMSVDEVRRHADKYSKAYNHGKGYGPWKDNFDAMAMKTVIKMLISKWGIMSIELEKAVSLDSSVIKEDGTPSYIDGELSNVNATEEKKVDILAAHNVVEKPTPPDDVDPETGEIKENPTALADEIMQATEPAVEKPKVDVKAEAAKRWGAKTKKAGNDNNSRSNPGER
jgi:recombination protein RecT